jgi:hypothetical protein
MLAFGAVARAGPAERMSLRPYGLASTSIVRPLQPGRGPAPQDTQGTFALLCAVSLYLGHKSLPIPMGTATLRVILGYIS